METIEEYRQYMKDLKTKGLHWCCDCRDGEHENIDDDVQLVIIRDPETNKMLKRGYVCREHRRMYDLDGYEIKYYLQKKKGK